MAPSVRKVLPTMPPTCCEVGKKKPQKRRCAFGVSVSKRVSLCMDQTVRG